MEYRRRKKRRYSRGRTAGSGAAYSSYKKRRPSSAEQGAGVLGVIMPIAAFAAVIWLLAGTGRGDRLAERSKQSGGGLLSGLLGSILGGNKEEAAPQAQQAAPKVDALSMLSGLMGSGSASSASSTSGMLSNLLGGASGGGLADLLGDDDDEASFNGSSLLSALLGK